MRNKGSSKDINKSNHCLGAVLIFLMIALFIIGVFAAYKLLTLPPEQRTLEQKEVSGACFQPTVPNKYQHAGEAPDGMAWIPGGEFSMGSEDPRGFDHGGSFLCTEEYCTRYMLGTRGKGEVSTGSNHLGFRCVMTDEQRKANSGEQE